MAAQDEAREIIEEFAFFDDWEDRYQHLIDMGRRLPDMDEAYKIEENRLRGCQSVVYFATEYETPHLKFFANSDAAIVQGLIAIMLRVYSGQTPKDILGTPPDFLSEIGLDEHLSATRKTGLAALVTKIMTEASQAAQNQ
jgi:cysteine desulfuration protein SufE